MLADYDPSALSQLVYSIGGGSLYHIDDEALATHLDALFLPLLLEYQ